MTREDYRVGIYLRLSREDEKLGTTNIYYAVWSTRTISDILKCQTYIGILTQCKQKKVNYKSKKKLIIKK